MTPTPDPNKPKPQTSAFSTGAWQDQQKQQQPQSQPAQQPPAPATQSPVQPQTAGAAPAPAPAGRTYYGEQAGQAKGQPQGNSMTAASGTSGGRQAQPAPSTYQPPQAPAQPQSMPQSMQSYYGMPSAQPSTSGLGEQGSMTRGGQDGAPSDSSAVGILNGLYGQQQPTHTDSYMAEPEGAMQEGFDSPAGQSDEAAQLAPDASAGPYIPDIPREMPKPGGTHHRQYYGENRRRF